MGEKVTFFLLNLMMIYIGEIGSLETKGRWNEGLGIHFKIIYKAISTGFRPNTCPQLMNPLSDQLKSNSFSSPLPLPSPGQLLCIFQTRPRIMRTWPCNEPRQKTQLTSNHLYLCSFIYLGGGCYQAMLRGP